MKKVFLFLFIITFTFAKDSYVLTYIEKNKQCVLHQNGINIELFDKRFTVKEPKDGYRCSALRQEQYRKCNVLENNNTTANVLAYGIYTDNNLVIAFRTDENTTSDSIVSVECE